MPPSTNHNIWQPLAEYSRFARRILRLWPQACDDLTAGQRLEKSGVAAFNFDDDLPESNFDRKLREHRQSECLRIAWRAVTHTAGLEQTLSELSELAQQLLQATLTYQQNILGQRFGQPQNQDQSQARFCVLAMGKLGGGELNFSSDIDVVFIHDGDGRTDGPRRIDSADYFTRLARAVIHSLDAVSEYGQVYRVDTRLRPYGTTGRLVWSTGAMQQYYLQEGRDWERYALLKAHAVAGDLSLGDELLSELQPFIFRRYLDYGLFAGVRQMRSDIATAAARRRHRDNLKLGPGGIREIEFLVYSLQLLRGGQQPALRQPNLLHALTLLEQHDVLDSEVCGDLEQSYRRLRELENGLQILDDQQTHDVPEDDQLREDWAQLCGFSDAAELMHALQHTRRTVAEHFDEWFGDDDDSEHPPIDLSLPLKADDLPGLSSETVDDLLPPVNASLTRINKQPLPPGARVRLEALLPDMLHAARQTAAADKALKHGLAMLETIAGRSNYLALLHEHPQALSRMLEYGARSDFIAEKLQRQPSLLDELIDPITLSDLPDSLDEYRRRLQPVLQPHRDDPEQQLYRLQHWRQSYVLRIAANELLEKIDTPTAQQQLSWLAEAVIDAVLKLTGSMLSEDVPLTIIAYGTLGAEEMHYQSDLDLVFLYPDEPAGLERLATRKAQKLIHLLTSMGPGERLYEIDTRLRPNGRSGTLVSSFRAFKEYQENQAWVWEWQALCRARCIHGEEEVRLGFEHLRHQLLAVARPEPESRSAIADMYQKISAQRRLSNEEKLWIKTQFLTQLWLLTMVLNEEPIPANNFKQLEYLSRRLPCNAGDYLLLSDSWRMLQKRRHFLQLDDIKPDLEIQDAATHELWRDVFHKS